MKRPTLPSRRRVIPFLVAVGLIGAGVFVKESVGSDHQQTALTELNPRLDITDVFAFPGSSSDRIVLAMTVASPLIGDQGAFFDPNVLYQLKIDNNQDGFEDVVFQFLFDQFMDGRQTVNVIGPVPPREAVRPINNEFPGPVSGTFFGGVRNRINTAAPAIRGGALNTVLEAQLPATNTAQGGTLQVFAGLRDDPFFVDLPQFFRIIPDRRPTHGPLSREGGVFVPSPVANAFRPDCGPDNQLDPAEAQGPFAADFGCARDFLEGFNALAIVVELPESQLLGGQTGNDAQIGVWATISR
jgi:hypothetical protein